MWGANSLEQLCSSSPAGGMLSAVLQGGFICSPSLHQGRASPEVPSGPPSPAGDTTEPESLSLPSFPHLQGLAGGLGTGGPDASSRVSFPLAPLAIPGRLVGC